MTVVEYYGYNPGAWKHTVVIHFIQRHISAQQRNRNYTFWLTASLTDPRSISGACTVTLSPSVTPFLPLILFTPLLPHCTPSFCRFCFALVCHPHRSHSSTVTSVVPICHLTFSPPLFSQFPSFARFPPLQFGMYSVYFLAQNDLLCCLYYWSSCQFEASSGGAHGAAGLDMDKVYIITHSVSAIYSLLEDFIYSLVWG